MNIRPRISVIVNTCNEGLVLADCLASIVGWADEVIVCDMQSSDDSVKIAERFGAVVWSHERQPAPEPYARTFAISKCTGDWIMVLDPDMTLSPALKGHLDQIVSQDSADIVDLHCLNFFFSRWCAHGHGSEPVFRKFFKRKAFRPVHKNIQTFWHDSLSGRVIGLPREYAILHYAYPTIKCMVDTLVRYARREADDDFAQGRSFRLHVALWKPARRFVGNYVARKGFLDGMPGLIVSLALSGYAFLIEAYLWELTRNRASRPIPAETAAFV